ncbi:MAG: LLM class flavin-dependent oxidoreductase [Hamadaea sp.]|nr:LLM class flavin-dependent oxidoreductase [Hamadaea sp.]
MAGIILRDVRLLLSSVRHTICEAAQTTRGGSVNYGHRLAFGTFVTPANADPSAVVRLAQRSEDLGFDLVTFQDHPYQPAFLDTWTLMSWVAGKTTRIRIAPNVLNLPLRDPAVLARAAASLDLLSDGRLDLALGAGAYWDAIAAMGGRRRGPKEAVDALSEAIDVIRGLLDAGQETPLRYAGEHYRVPSAQRGPMPAHHIPLCVGALKPRMLRLIGRQADGWLPSLGRLQPADLRTGNKIIDEAAVAAGREPADVRRLLNIGPGALQGPVDRWVEQLLPLAVEDGISTFILTADAAPISPVSTMERFAHEVIPALREAVDRELGTPLPRGEHRPSIVRARRRAGIDYDGIPASLAGAAVEPGDLAYPRVRSTYMRGGAPGIVLRPRTTGEVADALAYARAHRHLPFGVRSGGHGISGRSTNDGGVVLSLKHLNSIEIIGERRIRVGPGATWGEVAAALAPHGWALTSGDYGGVGVGGLATAGGVGWLARKHGLTLDHLRSAEVVLADGSVVRANAADHPDLFWAIRGAGANVGVVTSFEFDVDEVGDVGFAQFVFDAADPADLLVRWGAALEAAPRDVTGQLLMGAGRRGQPRVAQGMIVVDSDDPDTIIELLQPLADVAPLLQQQVMLLPYAAVMANASGADHDGQGDPAARSGLIDHLTPAFTAAAASLVDSGAAYFFQIRAVGGAVADVDPDATAYANRSANFHVTAIGVSQTRLDTAWDALHHHFSGTYLSFDTDRRPERLHDAWPPAHLARLREIKRHYDPDNLFRDNFTVSGDPS